MWRRLLTIPTVKAHTDGMTDTATITLTQTGGGDGEYLSTYVQVDPVEPACTSGEHDWLEGHPVGHDGGVVMVATCDRCALRCEVDTWATNPANGERGLRSTRYDRDEGEPADR